MASEQSSEVERLEPWALAGYLDRLAAQGMSDVTWNRERMALSEAQRRARNVGPTATVVVDGSVVYVAEPDHSADDTPRIAPIQLGPRPKPR